MAQQTHDELAVLIASGVPLAYTLDLESGEAVYRPASAEHLAELATAAGARLVDDAEVDSLP